MNVSLRYRITAKNQNLNGDQVVNVVQLHGLDEAGGIDFANSLNLTVADEATFTELTVGDQVDLTLATTAPAGAAPASAPAPV